MPAATSPFDDARRSKIKKRITCHRIRAQKYGVLSDGSLTLDSWITICDAQGYRCLRCGAECDDLMIDHIVSMSKGGANVLSNIQGLCPGCNVRKDREIANEGEQHVLIVLLQSDKKRVDDYCRETWLTQKAAFQRIIGAFFERAGIEREEFYQSRGQG